MANSVQYHLSLRDMVNFLFKYKQRMLLTFVLIFLLVGGGVFFMRPMYTSTAMIIVNIGRENIYNSVRSDSPGQFDFSVEQRINSKVEILTGARIIQTTIESLGVKTVYPHIENGPYLSTRYFTIPLPNFDGLTPMARAVLRFKKNLDVSRISKSDLIEIRFTHPDPDIAQQAVDTLLRVFINDHARVYQEGKRYDFLDQQVITLKRELNTAEDALEKFKSTNAISSLAQERTNLLELKSVAEKDLMTTRSDISENEGKLKALESTKGTQFGQETDINPLSISAMRKNLAELRMKEKEYLNLYTEDNPRVIGIRQEIAAASQLLIDEERDYHNKAKLSIIQSLGALRTKEDTQEGQLANIDKRLARIVSLELQLKRLERQVQINEDNYNLYVKKLEESRISRDMDESGIVNISTAESATLPIKPSKPNVMLGFGVAIILGIFCALLLALYSEFFSHSMNSAEEVKRLAGLDVAAVLPEM